MWIIARQPRARLCTGFQLWRLVFSIMYVPGLMNALIMSFVLYRLAAAWEQERGSIRIAYYFLLAAGPCSLTVCS